MKALGGHLTIVAALALTAGCVGWEQKFAAGDCKRAGFGVDHPMHEDCVNERATQYEAESRAQAQATREFLGVAAAIGAGAYVYSKMAPSAPASGYYVAPVVPQYTSADQHMSSPVSPLPSHSLPSTELDIRMCPDGSYVYGSGCTMAPDGSYVSVQARLAPDGSYVGGQPSLAPDGSYVGGIGQTRMCPDGSYVSGSWCRLTPNGTYVGVP